MPKNCGSCKHYSLLFQDNSNPEKHHCGNYILDSIPDTIWDGIRECELYEDKPIDDNTNSEPQDQTI